MKVFLNGLSPLINEEKYPSITILIAMLGNRMVPDTIKSIVAQNYPKFEIIILHNGIFNFLKGIEVTEKDEYYNDTGVLIRELFIRKIGKGNVLNEGICRTKSDLICVMVA